MKVPGSRVLSLKAFWPLVLFSILILYLKFPATTFQDIQHGLDPSWRAAIAYGITKGLLFGTDIVFTGGPLSGVYTREFEPNTAYLVVLISGLTVFYAGYALAISLSLATNLYIILASLIILHLCPIPYDTLLLLIPLLSATQGLAQNPGRQNGLLSATGAFLSGLLSLAKFSIFPVSLVTMLALDILAIRKGTFPVHLVLLAAGLCLGFIASGQPIWQLPEFLKSSMQFSSGYSSAMGLAVKVPELLAWLAFAAVYIMLLVVDFYRHRHSIAWYVLIVRIGIVVCFLFIAFKAGFVRQDLHTTIAWSALSVAILVTQLWSTRKSAARYVLIAMAGACVVPPWVSSYNTYQELPINFDIPGQLAQEATAMAKLVSDPTGWRDGQNAQNIAAMQSLRSMVPYPHLEGSVDVIQSEQSDVIANGLDYQPRPTMQEYATYNAELIARNRAFFESSQAPNYLVMVPGSIDQRHPASAEGALWPLFFSRYQPHSEFLDKLVLEKRPIPLTGVTGRSVSAQAQLGQDVPLPATSDPVMVSIQMTPTVVGKLLDLLYRPPMSEISVAYEDGTASTHRIIPGMASEGLLISPFVGNIKEYLLVSTGHSDYPSLRKAKSINVRVGSPSSAYRQNIVVTFTTLNNDSLRSGVQSDLLSSALKQQQALLPLLKLNVQNGTTISAVPEGLLAHAPTTLHLPTDGSSSLKVSFGMRSGAWSNGGHTNGACFIVRNGQDVLMRRCLDPTNKEIDRSEQTESVTLPANSKELLLETDCNGDCSWDWTYWSGTELN
jgi:hypothetical protein